MYCDLCDYESECTILNKCACPIYIRLMQEQIDTEQSIDTNCQN